MENNVVTLETAKKLKAAGFRPDKTIYVWRFLIPNGASKLLTWEEQRADDYRFRNSPQAQRFHDENEFYAAPTAQEIADQLPKRGLGWTVTSVLSGYVATITGVDLEVSGEMAPTMAEALAALYLKLNRATDEA